MYELSVIKVIDPSCFFCEILKVNGHEEYEQLFEELNMLYSYRYRSVEELKPTSLSIGQLCMVFCHELKSWCRASLESLTCSSEDQLVECFLLDHALYRPIRKSDIRFPVEQWYRLPFRATKFRLHQVRPISLNFNVYGDKMDFRPAKHWDSAAIFYFHDLLNEATKIKAQLFSAEDNCMSVYLYLTTKDSVLCVNDDLVAKNYACYEQNNSVDIKIENGRTLIPTVKELQSPGHRNGIASLSLTKEEAQALTKEMSKISTKPIMWPAWRCLDEGHTSNDQKMDTKSRHPQDQVPVLLDRREFASPSCQGTNVTPSGEQRQLHSSDSQHQNDPVHFKADSPVSGIHNERSAVQEDDSQSLDSPKGNRLISQQKDQANALESLHNDKISPWQKHEVISGVQNKTEMVLRHKHKVTSGVQNKSAIISLQKDDPWSLGVPNESQIAFHQNGELGALTFEKERAIVPLSRDESLASGVPDEVFLIQKDKSQAIEVKNKTGMVPLHKDESWASGVQNKTGIVPLPNDDSWALQVQDKRASVPLYKNEPQAIEVQNKRGMVLLQSVISQTSEVENNTGMGLLQKNESWTSGVQNQSCIDLLQKEELEGFRNWNKNGIGLLQKDNPSTLSNQSKNSSLILTSSKPLTSDSQKKRTLGLLQKDNLPFLANLSGSPPAFFNDESLVSQNRCTPVLQKTDGPPSLDNQHGRPLTLWLNDKNSGTHNGNTLLPSGKPPQPSGSQEHKVVTSLATVPYSAWNSIESDQNQDIPESVTAELRGQSEEKTRPLIEEGDIPYDEVFTAVQSPWPAFCNVDRSRRLSTEIKEKSIAKISTQSGNLSSSVSNNITQEQFFTKFLQFLNPTPKQLPEEGNDEQQPKIVRKSHQAAFVSKTLTAHFTLQSASLASSIKKQLMATNFSGPNVTEAYCWAPIAEGSDTVVISPDGSNPMCYIPPLLTYFNCASGIYKVLPGKHGPHAIVLCSTWDKCQAVFNILMDYSRQVQLVKPVLLLVGQSKEDIEGLRFRKPWELVVTTPHCLLRCMKHHGLLLQRLCHLVLDEVDVLFAKANSQMSAILEGYKRIVSVDVRDGTSQQIVAVGNKWHQELQLLLKYTSCPRVIITKMEQAAVFANVQQILHMCLECEKMSVLLHCLDFTPINAQKILIFTSSDEEAELVHKAVQTGSNYSLLLCGKEMHNFSSILEQWKKVFSHGTVLSLVVTDNYAPILEITDATSIIHYSFPQNTDLLNRRLYCLLDYVQSKIDKRSLGTIGLLQEASAMVGILRLCNTDCKAEAAQHWAEASRSRLKLVTGHRRSEEKVTTQVQDCSRAKSVLLVTEQHVQHAVDVLKSLKQAQAKIPSELIDLTEGILQAREQLNTNKELCLHLKRFGYCIQDKFCCPYRHHVNPAIDLDGRKDPIVETDQTVTVLPMCVLDAARFYGRIVTKDDPYEKLATQLNEYYNLAENRVPAKKVETNHLYALNDVSAYHRVLVLKIKMVTSVSYITVQYIDQGGNDHVPGYKLLQLPSVFHTLPPQYLEFIICRVKPIDTEVNWDSKVTRLINRSIRGKPHKAKVVLNLGRTYWLDPMVQMSSLIGLSTYVYDLNVRQEILATGMATDNPEHVTRLKALLNSVKTPPTAAVSSSSDECITRLESIPEELQVTMSPPPSKERQSDNQEDQPKEAQSDQNPPSMSLHPKIKWFEKGDTVSLAIKLQAITDHRCTFQPTRVLFSCHAEGNDYKADLDLSKEIDAEKCQCSVKAGEAIITLRKKKCESWSKLLTHKHPKISYDYDHLEDSEDSGSFPAVFKSSTIVSESQVPTEESDTESFSD